MSRRRKFLLVFIFVLVDMFIISGYFIVTEATMLNNLRKEINSLSKLDFSSDRYNTKIKTRGNYAVVEKSVKTYLDDYAVLLQDVMGVVDDPELTTILSYDNYKKDGPNFLNSIDYLNGTKENFNTKIDVLINNLEDEAIIEYGEERISDPYYQGLYEEMMFQDDMKKNYKETRKLLSKNKIKLNNVFDTSIEVLEFLRDNKDNWKLEDGEIKFLKQDVYDKYSKTISKISNK